MNARTTRAAAIVASAAAVALTGCGGNSTTDDSASTPGAVAGSSQLRGQPWANATHAPDFTLRDQTGQWVSLSAHKGRWVALTFLFTSCPDVCPLIATELNKVLKRIGPARDELEVLAVSVDPANDTPAVVRRYVRAHRLLGQFHYLIGTRKQLAPVWRSYYVKPTKLAGALVHSAFVLLIDPRGAARLVYPADVTAATLLHDLRLMGLRP
jgi:protein SCO1/2